MTLWTNIGQYRIYLPTEMIPHQLISLAAYRVCDYTPNSILVAHSVRWTQPRATLLAGCLTSWCAAGCPLAQWTHQGAPWPSDCSRWLSCQWWADRRPCRTTGRYMLTLKLLECEWSGRVKARHLSCWQQSLHLCIHRSSLILGLPQLWMTLLQYEHTKSTFT